MGRGVIKILGNEAKGCGFVTIWGDPEIINDMLVI